MTNSTSTSGQHTPCFSTPMTSRKGSQRILPFFSGSCSSDIRSATLTTLKPRPEKTRTMQKYTGKRIPVFLVRLLEGLPWVLAWLVRGCLLWQRDGLAPPRRIKADIEQLRLSEDVLGQFLESSCDCTDPESWMYFRELYSDFRAWYRANIDDRKDDKFLPSKKKVALWLDKKGFSKNNTGDRIYYGIRVTDPSLFAAGSG